AGPSRSRSEDRRPRSRSRHAPCAVAGGRRGHATPTHRGGGHRLYNTGHHVKDFAPELTPLQTQVLQLLGVPAALYTS
ncbi:MAG: hypothetical protein ACRD6W_09040, partial [Nitrososphaerales archaeon]